MILLFYSGIAGLSVTYGLNLNMLQGWLIWNLCNMENKIISVERIFQYTSIPSEPPLVIKESEPEPSWPSQGEVHIQNLQVIFFLQDFTFILLESRVEGLFGRALLYGYELPPSFPPQTLLIVAHSFSRVGIHWLMMMI